MSSKPLIKRGPSAALCSACCASLPPILSKTGDVFQTPCCKRLICPACLSSNPRLARYNPCLSCLGGVRAVSVGSRASEYPKAPTTGNRGESHSEDVNIDGAVRDSDVYILGDDEEEEEVDGDGPPHEAPPPPYEVDAQSPPTSDADTSPTAVPDSHSIRSTDPTRYYLKPGDTLLGIALRFGVDGRDLCRLNKLPPSTLSITPHLLHTRRFITLPTTAKTPPSLSAEELRAQQQADAEHRARRVREQAEKRLQTLTKEVDWRVARAYVALADDPEQDFLHGLKSKEDGRGGAASGLEDRAIDQYMDDEEWEAREMRNGRGAKNPTLPVGVKGKEKARVGVAGWPRFG